MKCIDDIKRLFDNKLLNDSTIYWFDGNFKEGLLDILKLSNKTVFIENSTVINKIHCSFIEHYEATLSKEKLEEQKNYLLGNHTQYLSHMTDDNIKNEFYRNKLQILNSCCFLHIKDGISPEICNQIIDNLIDCRSLLINFEDYLQYFNLFKDLCFYLKKDISNYFDLFNSITLNILKNYYNNFDKLLELRSIDLHYKFPKEISSVVMDKINSYKFNNVIKFLKEELRIIDNHISEGTYIEPNIYHLLDKFFSSFSEVCIKNKSAFKEIDFNSYKNSTEIKIFFINTLHGKVKMYFSRFNKQDIIDMVNRLPKFYCSQIEKFRFDAIIKETEDLKILK